MKIAILIGLLLAGMNFAAADETMATEASVRLLMQTTQSRKLVDSMMEKMDSYMQTSMKQALNGTEPTAQQQAVMDGMRKKMVVLFQEEMKWEMLEPKFIELYRQSFTEQEVEGMLEFYRTPAGQAVINKMPVVMDHSMTMMQGIMRSLMPKIQKIADEAMPKLTSSKKGG
jgi:hypothetical protein